MPQNGAAAVYFVVMPSVAGILVQALADAGIRHVFGMPGGGSNIDVIEAAGRAGIPFVLAHSETAGALMALAQAEITGQPGVCLATLGPGAASIVNGVACAFLERAPLLVFTDRHPASADGFPHQRLDHQALLAPITKRTFKLCATDVARQITCALDLATRPPAGPVHLDCAPDVTGASFAGVFDVPSALPEPGGPVVPPQLDDLLRGARKPLIIVGLGARTAAAARAVRRICDRGVPALVTYKAKGVVPDGHPFFAGVFTNAALEQPIVSEADLLVGIGLDPVELIPRAWPYRAPVVSCGASLMDTAQVPFDEQIVGDPGIVLGVVGDRLTTAPAWDRDDLRAKVEAQRQSIRVEAEGLSPHRVVEIVAEAAAGSARLTIDAGAHMFPATLLWPAREPHDVLVSNGLSTMGFALPAAIGASLLDGSRRVIALTGDAGLLLSVAELRTAARERLPILTVVFADGRLSLIDVKQRQRGYREAGVAIGDVHWAKLAAGLGVRPFSASTERELERAVADALADDGPTLVEARVDPSAYGPTLKAVRG